MSAERTERLLHRLAAAFMRDDVDFARKLVEQEIDEAVDRGRHLEKDKMRDANHEELKWQRSCNAWFVTKDGIRTKQRIDADVDKALPYAWKRPCRMRRPLLTDLCASRDIIGIETRSYTLTGIDSSDCLPIYEEQ